MTDAPGQLHLIPDDADPDQLEFILDPPPITEEQAIGPDNLERRLAAAHAVDAAGIRKPAGTTRARRTHARALKKNAGGGAAAPPPDPHPANTSGVGGIPADVAAPRGRAKGVAVRPRRGRSSGRASGTRQRHAAPRLYTVLKLEKRRRLQWGLTPDAPRIFALDTRPIFGHSRPPRRPNR